MPVPPLPSTSPGTLLANAACFKCIPKGLELSALIWLVWEWINGGGPTPPPVDEFQWIPNSEVVYWEDLASLPHNSDLPTFLAMGGLAQCTTLNLSGTAVTSVENAFLLTNLHLFDAFVCPTLSGPLDFHGLLNFGGFVINNTGVTSINCAGCTGMTSSRCSNSSLISLDVSGVGLSLQQLFLDHNQLPVLNLNGLGNLSVLDCSFNQLGVVHFVGDFGLVDFLWNNNPSISFDGP